MMILCGGGAFNIGDTDETGHTGTKNFSCVSISLLLRRLSSEITQKTEELHHELR